MTLLRRSRQASPHQQRAAERRQLPSAWVMMSLRCIRTTFMSNTYSAVNVYTVKTQVSTVPDAARRSRYAGFDGVPVGGKPVSLLCPRRNYPEMALKIKTWPCLLLLFALARVVQTLSSASARLSAPWVLAAGMFPCLCSSARGMVTAAPRVHLGPLVPPRKLIDEGLNIARLNFSHGDHEARACESLAQSVLFVLVRATAQPSGGSARPPSSDRTSRWRDLAASEMRKVCSRDTCAVCSVRWCRLTRILLDTKGPEIRTGFFKDLTVGFLVQRAGLARNLLPWILIAVSDEPRQPIN